MEGLSFDNAVNAVQAGFGYNLSISNCSFSGGKTAVTFTQSYRFAVSNNTVSDCASGIKVYSSRNFTVDNNTCLRTGYGLYLLDAHTFEVDNNTMTDCSLGGIVLTSSTIGTFRSNAQVNNGFRIGGPSVEHWASHDIDFSNTVNARPVLYASETHFAGINASSYGQVILVDTVNASISSADICKATIPIMMGFCTGCTVSIGNCSGSYAGILLSDCSGIVIDNTTIWNNDYGVIVDRSDRTVFTNDVIGNCPTAGIYSLTSRELDIRLNDMYQCGLWLEGFILEDFASHSISTDALVNGEPIYYIKDQVGGTIPENSGQVILANCSNILLANQTVSGSTIGVHINFSNNITVRNCTSDGNLDGLEMLRCYDSVVENCSFSSNEYGIVASFSARNVFRDNVVWGSSSWGFYLSSGSTDNNIYSNTFAYNFGTSSVYTPSFIQAYDGGSRNMWNASDGGNHWADWTTPDSDTDGIVDVPYVIFGPANGRDLLPLTESKLVVPEFGELVLVTTATALIVLVARAVRTRRDIGR
jgi:parallel beta-helix repeat protein